MNIDFRNTIIIMTSNLGAEHLQLVDDAEDARDSVMAAVRGHFRPEFLNRIDEVILFRKLAEEHMGAIVDIQLCYLQRLLDDLLTALVRVPRGKGEGGDASLQRALARDLRLELDGEPFDPLAADMGAPWEGVRPDALAAVDDQHWRTHGDTVERLELLAHDLIAGRRGAAPEWERSRAVLEMVDSHLRPIVTGCGEAERAGLLTGLAGRFVAPGSSGAPTRGRPDVLPTGRNFYSVDTRAVPTPAAWQLGWKSACLLLERYRQENGAWPERLAISAWGTANMRTGGDDIAQALALMGVKPEWDVASGRVTGFEILPSSVLDRPRVDVTFRVSGFFRDAFPFQIDLLDSAARAVAKLDEPTSQNPLAARYKADAEYLLGVLLLRGGRTADAFQHLQDAAHQHQQIGAEVPGLSDEAMALEACIELGNAKACMFESKAEGGFRLAQGAGKAQDQKNH